MKTLSEKWQKLIVWLSGYLNIIAFFLAGGYLYLKTDSDDVKTSGKTVLFLTAIFTGLDLLRGLLYNILSVAEADYEILRTISTVGTVFVILKAVVFATLFILDLCGIKLLPIKNEQKNDKQD